MRCCNNCEPRLFEVEQITLNKAPAFKRGKKWKTSTAFEDAVQNNLTQWHDNELLDHFYGGTSIIAGSTLLGNDVIEKLAMCGERVETMQEFVRHAHWPISFNTDTGTVTEYGHMLLGRLQTIYSQLNDEAAAEEADFKYLQSLPPQVSVEDFYSVPSQQPCGQPALTAETYLQHNSNAEASGSRGRGRAVHGRGVRGGRKARRGARGA
jgi:hypothetical protein